MVTLLEHVFLLSCAGIEGCYNGFPTYGGSNVNENVYASDLCGYMYLFNNNKALLSQYATLGYNFSGPLLNFSSDKLFKDLGMAGDYGGMYTATNLYNVAPYMSTILYANMACTYEHFLVRALMPPNRHSLHLALNTRHDPAMPARRCRRVKAFKRPSTAALCKHVRPGAAPSTGCRCLRVSVSALGG